MNGISHRSLVAICLAALLASPVLAQPIDPRPDLREVVADYLRRAPQSDGPMVVFKGVGSWVHADSPGFRNPLAGGPHPSDMDLTMVIAGATPAEAAEAWRRAQRDIRDALAAKLTARGVPADEIARLDREYLTIYPPAQVMADVKDVDDANAVFKALGTWPKPGQNVEGLYGDAARAWTQNYEATKGTVFFLDSRSGTLAEGATDLAHLMEGHGRWTLRSTAGLSDQLADKALDAIRQNDAIGAVKNLGRLEGAMTKARDLGRIPPDSELATLLATADFGAPDDPKYGARASAWLDEHRRDVERLLGEARDEARTLQQLADAWGGRPIPIGRVDRFFKSARFGPLRAQATEWARATGRAAGPVLRRLLIATGIAALAVEAAGVAAVASDEGLSPAALDAFQRTVRFLNLPGELVEGVLEEARVGGIGLVTRFQDCEDLVAGVFSVKGRERTGDGYQIVDLGRRFAYAHLVTGAVERKAWQAASRGWTADLSRRSEAVEDALEADIAESLTARCVPPIATAWQEERSRLVALVVGERSRLDEAMARTVLALEAAASGDTTTVRVVETFDAQRAGRAIDGMVAALGRVNEAASRETGRVVRSWWVRTRAVWSVNGAPRDPLERTRLVLAGSDFDPLAEVRAGLTVPTMPPGVTREVALSVTVDVEPSAVVGDLFDPPGSLEGASMPLLATTYQWHAAWTPPALTGLEVTGTVTNRTTGEPLPGARIVLVGERTHTATADADGGVSLTGLAPGDYRIEIGHEGFVTRRGPVSVTRPLRNRTFALSPVQKETTAAARAPRDATAPSEDRPARSVDAPPPPARETSTEFTVSFGDSYVPKTDKSDVGQRFTFTAPGPGTITVSYTYRPAKPSTVRYYGDESGYRSQARVEWSVAGQKPGRVNAGWLYRGTTTLPETTGTGTFAVAAAGPVELKAYPEETPAYFYRNQWVDNWYDATHVHYHGATAVIKVQFTPAR